MKKKRPCTPSFKTKVVLEALKEQSTISALAQKHEIQSSQILAWKKQFLENADNAFNKNSKEEKGKDELIESLYNKIGQMNVELDFVKKNLMRY